jgi:EVE domain
MYAPQYWIGIVSADHVDTAGYVQLNHGRADALERMRGGDGFAFYSPRATHPDGEPMQAYTAMGCIRTGVVYQTDDSEGGPPFRLGADFLPAMLAPIRPLLAELTFIRSQTHWGAAFRFGVVRVPEVDLLRIARAMDCRFPVLAGCVP